VPDDLKDHDCLMMRRQAERGRWRFDGPGGTVEIGLVPRVASSDLDFVRIMAERGMGVAYLPDFVLQPVFAAGRLVPLLEDWRPAGREMYVVFPGGRGPVPRVRAFLDFVLKRVAAGSAWPGEV
jgi:DNA-binding transcriptional LysR family regulator